MTAFMVNHLWQSTVVLLVAGLAARAWRGRPAAVRHGVWLLASLKFLVPFDVLMAAGQRLSPALPGVPTAALGPAFDAVVAPLLPSRLLAAPDGTGVMTASGLPVSTLLIVVWAAVALLLGLRWTAVWLRIRRLAQRRITGAASDEFQRLVFRIAARMGVSPPPDIALSTETIEPGIFGILRPTLLWPRDLTDTLSPSEVEAVVAHELVHVKRRDNLTGAIHGIVQTLFWFHPLLPVVGTHLHRERERACDEYVLLSGHPRRTYAAGIVKTCEFCTLVHQHALVGATGHLRDRVAAILGHPLPGTRASRAPLMLAGALLLLMPVGLGATLPHAGSGTPRIGPAAPTLRVHAPAAANVGPTFEVASVKRNTGSDLARRFEATRGGRVNLINLTLRELVFRAYQMQDHMLVGGPDWMSRDRFDIVARAAADSPPSQLLPLVRQLLADRFHLTMHRETRDMPRYDLTLARPNRRLGPRLVPTTCVPPAPGGAPTAIRTPDGVYYCGVNRFAPGEIVLTGSSLDTLANRLGSQAQVGRSVVNTTGIGGLFDIELTFSPDASEQHQGGRSIFTAIQEELGLRLVPARGPVEVLVIDSVQPPDPD